MQFLFAATLVALAQASTLTSMPVPAPAHEFDASLACYTAVKPGEETRAVDGLFPLVKSPHRQIANDAVDVLARLDNPDSRAALAVVLCGNLDPTLRARAADRFGDLGDADAAWVLAIAVDHETNAEVRDVLMANLERAASHQVDPWKDVVEARLVATSPTLPAAPSAAAHAPESAQAIAAAAREERARSHTRTRAHRRPERRIREDGT